MSRLKQNQSIDGVINCINAISESQCSLSETDSALLAEALVRLNSLRKKKGKTNGQIREEITQVLNLVVLFFTKK
ncbi:hypothetical protein ACLI08_05550 [Flavobacterium sp. RNTU_13]|uniref:hypothetical protein n=1 Tax=Flavobacterium sp. RNTU_13 TaxID=3375145 RepID=UPI0039883DDC